MKEVKIYTIVSDQLSPPITGESFCTDMVRHSDYADLEEKFAALVAENATLKNPDNWLSQSDYGYEAAEVAAQNGATNDESLRAGMIAIINRIETPATDAFLAEVRAKAHKEGAYFVANRMLAAWDAGFIDDTAKNAADIARMILTSTEFMADAPEGDFDRSFADGVLEDIAAQLRKGGNQ
ncbi:ead/Ea22-like family protein [Salmonella enterica subsp. enterica serovar Onderstepoort]|nr:ead/Ea22-like family protein [Salmonella enterica subsp. enterica serovar Onderstepoort]